MDRAARWVVSAGGLATIAGILGIFGFICWEMSPLWAPPRAAVTSRFTLTATEPLRVPVTEEYREMVQGITAAGVVRFLNLSDGAVVQELTVPSLAGKRVANAARNGTEHVWLASQDGYLVAVRVRFDVQRNQGTRRLRPRLTESGIWTLSAEGRAPYLLAGSVPDEHGSTVVYAYPDEAPALFAVIQTQDLFGATKQQEVRAPLPLSAGGSATGVAVSGDGRRAYVATSNGFLHAWDLANKERPQLIDVSEATARLSVPITSLAFLTGDRSLIVGDGSGAVSVWFPVRDDAHESGWRLRRVHELAPHAAAVTSIVASQRDRRFATADASGKVRLHHATTAQTLMDLPGLDEPVAALAFSPKADGGLSVGRDGSLVSWKLDNPHPEVSLRALFGRLWYEGYDEPSYVWQSTGGTDAFEPKLSLIPLIIGTMKGTLYALLFAVPVAVLAAIYTSQFVRPGIRNVVKPTVEIMAALPSVVLGFLAGLWLAPIIEGVVPGVLTMVVVVPTLMFTAGVLWGQVPVRMRSRLRPGTEVFLLVPIIIIGGALCLWANDPIERLLFGGDFRAWLLNVAGLRFDQRNCVVVGFAMGCAVMPIIFTISEDALANVPQRLISGSLALGATPWQTAIRVVFPTASPGIFSAAMIGFGRAVGETMIVLMATGNTPVLDWNIFTGMRTLSASIAVEIPEAPYGSTLYRVLFLAALLLFLATFAVNTAAELVRQRLRRRYQQL
jgi:phosphate transport system permease protein